MTARIVPHEPDFARSPVANFLFGTIINIALLEALLDQPLAVERSAALKYGHKPEVYITFLMA
jgi:hypothetical protein